MKHCEACHSQLREDGSHYQMTACVQEEITNLKAENERLRKRLWSEVYESVGNHNEGLFKADTAIHEATKESDK